MMARITFVDVPKFETSVGKIEEQLMGALRIIRSRRVLDDPANDFPNDVMDEMLRQAARIRKPDLERIARRATRLAQLRIAAMGTSHLKKEELARLAPVLDGVRVVMPKGEHWVDEAISRIHCAMPWMAAATDYAWKSIGRAMRRGGPIHMRPLLLVGPPGIGKSHWAERVALELGLPFAEIDASRGNSSMSIAGTERGWAGTQPGRPMDTVLSTQIGNPVMIVDELCKAGTVHSIQGTAHSFVDALLGYLEAGTARRWTCPCFRLRFDMSHLIWVMTANTVETIPETVLNRCEVLHLPDITSEELKAFARAQAAGMDLSAPALEATLEAIELAPARFGKRLSLRDVVRMIERAEGMQARRVVH